MANLDRNSDFEAYHNVDQALRPQSERRIRQGETGGHAGKNFYGYISFDGHVFDEKVVRFGHSEERFSAPTLQAVIDKVNIRFAQK